MVFDFEYYRKLVRLGRPRLAYCLMAYPKVPICYTMRVTFGAENQDQILSDSLAPFGAPGNKRRAGCDFYVTKEPTYTIHRPNAFVGSVFKGDSDWKNCGIPYVSIRHELENCVDLAINTQFSAIETVWHPAIGAGPDAEFDPWLIPAIATIYAEFQLTKRLAEDEIPYTVEVAWKGHVLTGCMNLAIGIVSDEMVASYLKEKLEIDVHTVERPSFMGALERLREEELTGRGLPA